MITLDLFEQWENKKPGVAEGSKTVCPSCHSADVKTYSDGEKECNHCHRTWDVQGMAEGKPSKGKLAAAAINKSIKDRKDPNRYSNREYYNTVDQKMKDERVKNDLNKFVRPAMNEQGVAEGADDLRDSVLDVLKAIYNGSSSGEYMIDTLADEFGQYYDEVEASGDQSLQNAYSFMMDNGQEADSDPQAMAQIAKQAISMLTQGVAEGLEEQVYKVVALDKSNALKKPTKLNVKASSIEDVFSRLAANDWYALSINGVEVVGGKRLKQGVAEEVDTGEYDARKTIPSSKEKNDEVFRKHRERMKALDKDEQGVAEGGDVPHWRVEQSKATGRYYVVSGYSDKSRKVWKSKLGAIDFVKKADAEAKAQELNQGVAEGNAGT